MSKTTNQYGVSIYNAEGGEIDAIVYRAKSWDDAIVKLRREVRLSAQVIKQPKVKITIQRYEEITR